MNKRQPSALMRLNLAETTICCGGLATITNRLTSPTSGRTDRLHQSLRMEHDMEGKNVTAQQSRLTGQNRWPAAAQLFPRGKSQPMTPCPASRRPLPPSLSPPQWTTQGPENAYFTHFCSIHAISMPYVATRLAVNRTRHQEAIRTGQWGQYHSPLIKVFRKDCRIPEIGSIRRAAAEQQLWNLP